MPKAKDSQKDSRIRSGVDVSPEADEEFEERRLSYAVLTTNSKLTKILRDGKVEIIPTAELYVTSPDEREGYEVDDPTVTGPLGIKPNVIDEATRELGAARLAPGPVLAGRVATKSAAKKSAKSATTAEATEPEFEEGDEGDFDVNDPRATPIAELEEAIDGLSDAEVKKAQKNDDRAGAQKIYERRLSGE